MRGCPARQTSRKRSESTSRKPLARARQRYIVTIGCCRSFAPRCERFLVQAGQMVDAGPRRAGPLGFAATDATCQIAHCVSSLRVRSLLSDHVFTAPHRRSSEPSPPSTAGATDNTLCRRKRKLGLSKRKADLSSCTMLRSMTHWTMKS